MSGGVGTAGGAWPTAAASENLTRRSPGVGGGGGEVFSGKVGMAETEVAGASSSEDAGSCSGGPVMGLKVITRTARARGSDGCAKVGMDGEMLSESM